MKNTGRDEGVLENSLISIESLEVNDNTYVPSEESIEADIK